MTILKEDSLWIAELVEHGEKYKTDSLNSSQRRAVDKFISGLKALTKTDNGGCTTIDFYQVKIGSETIEKEDECAYWLGYKFLKQQIFPNKY